MLAAHVHHREIVRARELFDGMPRRDVVSWNTMLLGYSLTGQIENARHLFDRMPERDTFSWNIMISGYGRCGWIIDAVHLFEKMPVKNVVSWNAVVTGLLANGEVDWAMEMWSKMPIRDSATLSTVVSGLARNGMLEAAERLLLKADEGDVDAYNTLVAAFGRVGRVDDARRLFEMIPSGCQECGLLEFYDHGYVKAGGIRSARRLFDEMPERDRFSWNTMIAGYVQSQELDEAAALLQQMPEPDERTWNLMISGFARSGDVERAQRCFERMPHRSAISWNTIIAGYERVGEYRAAMSLFSRMLASGVAPDGHTLSSALGACAGLASLRQGAQVHQLVTKRVAVDTPINNALVTMYSRCGSLTDARRTFDSMTTRKDVVSWNAIISGYAQHGHAEEALRLFSRMEEEVRPTHITFISVLHACCHGGLHYAALVDLLGRHGRLEEAMGIVGGMPVPPDRTVWGALLGACRVHRNDELARIAMAALAAVDPAGSAPYVLLCNMHAGVGRWAEAAEVREAMEQQGIRKQAGYSWIELQSGLHVFAAGDKSHPLALEILATADSCSRAIRDETHAGDLPCIQPHSS
ncbi:unnamed protein product [Spirodela intermedia]|uniref:Uncharacterized protein n=1 Tax=Spirodela intermedia TaxID=51605 RepID=A0A7I8IQH5_SPIIN|nr:unnamed protein product [Spirodela intermedia]CAA6659784.1 unnamed protein product [Spirodela intermedia]